MSEVQFNCPECDGLFQVDETLAGQQVECPNCAQVIQLPEISDSPPPPPAGEDPVPPPPPSSEPPTGPPTASEPPPLEPPPATPPGDPPTAADPPPGEPPTESPSAPPTSEPPAPVEAQPPTMLVCPLCEGRFQVEATGGTQHVECPHCQETIAVELEPPPESTGEPPVDESSQPPATESKDEGDLPPSAMGIDGIVPGKEKATAKETVSKAEQTMEIETEDGVVTLTEESGKSQFVGKRRLDRAKKGRKRTIKNLVIWGFSAIILIGVLAALMWKG